MCEVMKVFGDINYLLPHKKKKQLEDAGNLPLQVTAAVDDVMAAIQYLHSPMPNAQVAQNEVEVDEDDWEHED